MSSYVEYVVGATPQDTFVVPFQFWEKGDLRVTVGETITTSFTVSGEGDPTGGFIFLSSAVANTTVGIQRLTETKRFTIFPIAGPFRIEALNTEFDRVIAMITDQQYVFENLQVDWDQIQNKPTEFPPEPHLHPQYAEKEAENTFTEANTFEKEVTVNGFLLSEDGIGARAAKQDLILFWNTSSPQVNTHVLRGGNDGNPVLWNGSTQNISATFEGGGTASSFPTTNITREKGDTRYVNIDFDDQQVGNNFTIESGSAWLRQYHTGNSVGLKGLGQFVHTTGALRFAYLNDDYSYGGVMAQIDRDGGASESFSLLTREQGDLRYASGGGETTTIVEADVGVNEGWQVWGDTLVQWGIVPARGNTNPFTITFDQAFKVTPSISFVSDGTGNRTIGIEGGITATVVTDVAMKVGSNADPADGAVRWIAIGEAPDDLKQPKEIGVIGVGEGGNLPPGGTAGQILSKIDGQDYNTEWRNETGGGPGGAVDSVFTRTGDVVAEVGDYAAYYAPISHTHTESEITDLDRVRPRGNFVDGNTYLLNDMATQDGYTGVVTAGSTTDPLAPVNQGDPLIPYQGNSPRKSTSAKTLLIGQEYTLDASGSITEYEIDTVVGNHYTVYKRVNAGLIEQIVSFTANSAGWQSFTTQGSFFPANTVLELFVVIDEPAPGDVETVLTYDYIDPNNAAIPISGQITHANKAQESFRVHYVDQGSTNNVVYLRSLTVGDTIEGAGTRWSIQEINDFAGSNYIEFVVAPALVGIPGTNVDFTFTTTVSTPISHIEDDDYFALDNAIRGMKAVDGAAISYDNDAYGVNIAFQAATLSDDWWIISTPSTGGSSGGGGEGATTFLELSDTPASYAGQDFYVPRVDEGNNQLVFDDFANYFVSNTGGTFTGPVNFNNAGQDQIRLNNLAISQPFAHVIRATTDGDFGISHGDDSVIAAIVESSTDSLKDPLSVVTREKGDARYTKSDDVRDIEVMTQAEYDGITPVATTMYVIVG